MTPDTPEERERFKTEYAAMVKVMFQQPPVEEEVEPFDGIEKYCLAALRSRGATVSTAESLTAGLISAALASVPGASDVLLGGLAAYATDVKLAVLGVDAAVVERFGVVSAECAGEMASRARDLFRSTWAVSATGVAGPDLQEGKAAGTVFIAVAGSSAVEVRALTLHGSRDRIRRATVEEALLLLSQSVV